MAIFKSRRPSLNGSAFSCPSRQDRGSHQHLTMCVIAAVFQAFVHSHTMYMEPQQSPGVRQRSTLAKQRRCSNMHKGVRGRMDSSCHFLCSLALKMSSALIENGIRSCLIKASFGKYYLASILLVTSPNASHISFALPLEIAQRARLTPSFHLPPPGPRSVMTSPPH